MGACVRSACGDEVDVDLAVQGLRYSLQCAEREIAPLRFDEGNLLPGDADALRELALRQACPLSSPPNLEPHGERWIDPHRQLLCPGSGTSSAWLGRRFAIFEMRLQPSLERVTRNLAYVFLGFRERLTTRTIWKLDQRPPTLLGQSRKV